MPVDRPPRSRKNLTGCISGLQYDVKYLMADSDKGIKTAQQFEFPNCRRLMCWAHVIRKIIPFEKWHNIERDISTL